MRNRRSRLPRILVSIFILAIMASAAACGLGARRQPTAQSARGINYPSERASTFDKGNFGRGTTSIAWRAPWVITASIHFGHRDAVRNSVTERPWRDRYVLSTWYTQKR